MGVFNFLKNEEKTPQLVNSFVAAPNVITEKLKGKVETKEVTFPKDLGEEHPFDYCEMEKLLKTYGVASAVVEKHIDFILSSGIQVASEDERAKQIIKDFMRDFDFITLLRPWVRESLGKGSGFMELGFDGGTITGLKVLNSNYMYVKRNDVGEIESYTQYMDSYSKYTSSKAVTFKQKEIAQLNFNLYNDDAYGFGIIQPAMVIINDLIGSRREMHTLMKRKANSPFIFTVGDKDKGLIPKQSELDALGSRLEWLNNKHEWVLTDMVKASTLDFGNIGSKFEFIIGNDMEIFYMATQIPALLMGSANVNMGIAKEQMKAWEYRIQSLREEIEKVIEEKIFKPVLNAQGIDEHVEIIWGLPSNEEKNDRAKILIEALKNPFMNSVISDKLQLLLADVLGIPADELMTDMEEREKEEEKEKLPKVPSALAKQPSVNPPESEEHIGCTCNESVHEDYDGMTVKEWVGFNYQDYNDTIINLIRGEMFEDLRGFTKAQLKAGMLSSNYVGQVRLSMEEAFTKNYTIKQLEKTLNKRIDFKDRHAMMNGKVMITKDKKPRIAVRANRRANMIARTESIRMANKGALENYKSAGYSKVRWVAAMSDRTCPICAPLNGQVFDINNTHPYPAHVNCRCTFIPVIEEKHEPKI